MGIENQWLWLNSHRDLHLLFAEQIDFYDDFRIVENIDTQSGPLF